MFKARGKNVIKFYFMKYPPDYMNGWLMRLRISDEDHFHFIVSMLAYVRSPFRSLHPPFSYIANAMINAYVWPMCVIVFGICHE